MERIAIVARLKAGSGRRAAQLVAAGPPFDLAETGIVRHSVYLSAGEVVFVFEGLGRVDGGRPHRRPLPAQAADRVRPMAGDRRRVAAHRQRTFQLGAR